MSVNFDFTTMVPQYLLFEFPKNVIYDLNTHCDQLQLLLSLQEVEQIRTDKIFVIEGLL